ncbi:MAG TPA: polyphosphate kinase [Alphaproteobacteria bacterium]|jgi:polyphosphate kinase 2 (PPK2 family)
MPHPLPPASRLSDVDLRGALDKSAYKKRHGLVRTRLREIQLAYKFADKRAVVLIEGWDAVGKGGVIRRLTSPLDPRGYHVWPIGAPTEEERGEHYLQRFWRRLPPAGVMAVFDRSWYGRVLVERVEGFAKAADWKRGYGEINAFEKMLTDDGVRIVKLFLHISAETQSARLLDRMTDPLEAWKMTPSDLRNVELRPEYEAAIDEMFERCSPRNAPWHAVPFAQKAFGRIAALETVASCLSEGLDMALPPLDEKVAAAARKAGLLPAAKAKALARGRKRGS